MTTTDGRARPAAEPPGEAPGQVPGEATDAPGGRHAKSDPTPGTDGQDSDAAEAEAEAEAEADKADYVPRHAKPDAGAAGPPTERGGRVRVVLAERRTHPRAVHTLAEVAEQSPVGEVLLQAHMKVQLGLALRLGGVAVLVLGSLPLLFATLPQVGDVSIVGIRLPWLLLGVLVYPFYLLLGWLHTRSAERNERDFVETVKD